VTDAMQPVTTEILWRGGAILACIAAIAIPITARLVPASRFRQLRVPIILASFLVWAGMWLAVLVAYWQPVYRYLFPSHLRWFLPVLFGLGFALASLPLFSFASRRPKHPALLFLLLGAALGPITHLFAVYRGVVDRPPVLQGASPVAAVLVSFPEFALYWCVILLLAALLKHTDPRASPRA
jgi:hypothetical protein